MKEQVQSLLEGPQEFVKDCIHLLNRCTKPDRRGKQKIQVLDYSQSARFLIFNLELSCFCFQNSSRSRRLLAWDSFSLGRFHILLDLKGGSMDETFRTVWRCTFLKSSVLGYFIVSTGGHAAIPFLTWKWPKDCY